MRNKGRSFLAKNYIESWNYIAESRKFIYAIVVIFLASVIISIVLPVPSSIKQQLLNFIGQLIKQTDGMNQFELIKFILFNNIQSSLAGMIFGIFLGVFPVVVVAVNGYLLGFVALMTIQKDGFFVLWKLFPHGIFELPAVFISLGLGLKLGTFIFQKKKAELFRNYFWNSLKVFFFVVIPLLIVAAIIEGSLIAIGG